MALASTIVPGAADGFTYLASGPASAPPVVFLHGIGGGARMFSHQLDALGGDRRAIAWNMPGYGGSVPIEPSGIDGYAQALRHFLKVLGLDRPVLVGHSIGGMVVQSYLALGLGPIDGAVLAQTTPAFGGRDPRWAEDFVKARLEPFERGQNMAELAEGSVAGMVGDDPDPAGIALAREIIAETPEAAFRASTLAMIGFDRRDALERIAVPTLLVAGSKDTNAPAPTVAKMAERIRGAELVTLEGCGHLVMLERPDAFTAALRTFLSRVSESA